MGGKIQKCIYKRKESQMNIKLSEMKKNQIGKITHFEALSEENIRKLLSLDLAPNAKITILLSQPTVVIKSEYSEVAIDHFLAEKIVVYVE
jgi:Fe2+ transport system protein FeoA